MGWRLLARDEVAVAALEDGDDRQRLLEMLAGGGADGGGGPLEGRVAEVWAAHEGRSHSSGGGWDARGA